MHKKPYIAIILEGRSREPKIISNLLNLYLKEDRLKIIHFTANQNIYMLWKSMDKDNFETDIIEVIKEYSSDARDVLQDLSRDDFSEVYLFFDYDGHQNNISKSSHYSGDDVINQMLNAFDNETENGKLYISYPMVESLRDFNPKLCLPVTSCVWDISDMDQYKCKSSQTNKDDFRKYTYDDWSDILSVFLARVGCLFDKTNTFSFSEYRNTVSPQNIFKSQKNYINNNKIFILSAFPEFLLDYNKEEFWNKNVYNIKPVCNCISKSNI